MTEKFGNLESDIDVKLITTCRDIVKEILNFGVTQEQILLIIQFLGAEIEHHESMVEVVTLARELLKNRKLLFIDKIEDENGQI